MQCIDFKQAFDKIARYSTLYRLRILWHTKNNNKANKDDIR